MVSRVGRGTLAGVLLGLFFFARPTAAPAAPVVPGFERYGQSETHKGGAGQLLLTELNCVLCHQGPATAPAAKQGPILDQVGQRVRAGYLRRFLKDPHEVKPGTTMPAVFANDPERDAKVEALVHFLGSTGTPRHDRMDSKSVSAGRDLYHRIGCVACHGSRTAQAEPDKTTPATVPLVELRSKYSIPSLAAFLENPHQVRPSGRMPLLLIDNKERPKEAKDLASYLLQGIKASLPTGPGTTQYAYYEGSFEKLPNFAKLTPKSSGVSGAFDLSPARRRSNYAMRFDGYFKVPAPGKYRLHLTSDDGSRLEIDGKRVIDHDGVHAPATANVTVDLTAGLHKVTVSFFQAQGGDELSVEIEGPNLGRRSLADMVAAEEAALTKVTKASEDRDDPDYLDVQPALVEKGRGLFATAGCASCHQVKGLKPETKAVALAKLKPAGGCLSPAPVKGLPWYALNDAQRQALAGALKSPAPSVKTPGIAQTMLTFNCYACHVRDKVGGPEEALDKLFLTSQPEMGDEARIPPPLDGVGAKLRPEYLKKVLNTGARDRPYMLTRMPGFGEAGVGHLQTALADADRGKFPTAPEPAFADSPGKVKAAGRHMVGGQAFGCIKCHTFAGYKAEGVQGIDMVLMPQRVNHDWFHAYLYDPQKVRPGTRMPTIYDKGKSLLANVLEGSPAKQSEAIWLYLQDGKKAALPVGVKKQSIPLVPIKDAIIYRNFIEGSGARAIGVGYPEKVNVAFDANDVRLSLLWHGAFMDAGRHWSGRGEGFEPPLGDNILALPPGSGFAFLTKAQEPWPAAPAKNQGLRFGGYQLTPDDRPTFLYSLGDIRVEDFPNAVVHGREVGIRRTLTLSAARDVDNLYFRAAVGNRIEPLGNGVYQVDGHTKIKLTSHSTPSIRQAGEKLELLLPVSFTNNKARIVQEFTW